MNKTWDSTSLDDGTLATMVEDQVYLKNASKLGITITDQDIDNYITQLFPAHRRAADHGHSDRDPDPGAGGLGDPNRTGRNRDRRRRRGHAGD